MFARNFHYEVAMNKLKLTASWALLIAAIVLLIPSMLIVVAANAIDGTGND